MFIVDAHARITALSLLLCACGGLSPSEDAYTSAGRGGGGAPAAPSDGDPGSAGRGAGGSNGGRAGAGVAGTDAGGGASGGAGSGGGAGGGPAPQPGAVIEPGDPGEADVRFTIRADRAMRPISPLIYGVNNATQLDRTRPGLLRSGGNRLTAYNWENNASNAGSDYMFQNDGHLDASDEPGKVPLDLVERASALGAAAVVTLPLVDYVSADKNGGGDVRNSGADYLQTRFRKNLARKGSAFAATPDANDGEVYQDEFVAWLEAHAPAGARVLFSLDNEPDLWSHTHAEVHPEPVTYEELWTRNRDFAAAAKAVWPEAQVLGFVSYGFNGYVTLQNAPDANGRTFLDFYLQQAKAEHDRSGERLIDYLDLHWYPEARGGGVRITEPGTSAELIEARVQAPRSLWDPNYEEQSWVRDYMNRPIDLLHWVQAKIDANYPGTKLAITEWNYGGGNHVSGAIAVADVLGIFGREGVGLAAYWPLQNDESFAWAAFRAYCNYDGDGARFGDTSIEAVSSDHTRASVYASYDASNPARSVIIAINKTEMARSAALRIAHPNAYARAAVFRIVAGSAELQRADPLTAVAVNAFRYEMPAQSVSVLVPE